MKFLRGLFLVAGLLAVSFAVAQSKAPKGYDIGACAPDGFMAAHVLVVGKDLKMDLVSPAPNKVEKEDKEVVYKFVSVDEDGNSHYLFAGKDVGHKLEFVLNFDKKIGAFVIDDKPQAFLFLMADDDGSKLAENALVEVKACLSLLGGQSQDN